MKNKRIRHGKEIYICRNIKIGKKIQFPTSHLEAEGILVQCTMAWHRL